MIVLKWVLGLFALNLLVIITILCMNSYAEKTTGRPLRPYEDIQGVIPVLLVLGAPLAIVAMLLSLFERWNK